MTENYLHHKSNGTLFRKAALILFSLLPFHVLIVYIIGNQLGYDINDARFIFIKMWKEGVVLLSLMIYFFGRMFGLYFGKKFLVIDYLFIVYFFLGIFYVLISDRLLMAIWSFRTLYAFLLLYLFGRIQNFEVEDFIQLTKVMFFIAIITALFGVYQVEVVGEEFHLIFYGEEAPVQLQQYDYERIRATSTFISVHEFGLFLTLQLFSFPLLFSISKSNINRLYLFFGGFIILIGLFYSYSRSAILILVISLLFLGFRRAKYFFLVSVVIMFIYVLLSYFGALANLETVVSGKDPSAAGHEIVVREAVNSVIKNPLGIGLGKVGVIARRFDPSAPQYEGEWFNILVQMGFAAGMLILIIYYLLFRIIYRIIKINEGENKLKNLSLLIILTLFALVLRDFILPRDQMNYFLGWFLIGSYISFLQNKKLVL